ncbi:MAG: helix-turn-helix transcriptional regulator [Anaerolineaceae bacterium]|nr:helix-turn-helix transcriptional regulator [Anaerolineaceae bacterium]
MMENARTERALNMADGRLLHSVADLSAREGHPPDEMILILLDQAVRQRRRMDRAHRNWDALSPREKQVAALICESLTGRQIAARLFISPETVKTHVRHVLRKFSISSRRELRRLLTDWDLSPWLSSERLPLIN